MKYLNRKTIISALAMVSSSTVLSIASLAWAAPELNVMLGSNTMTTKATAADSVYVRIAGPNGYFKELRGTGIAQWNPGADALDGLYRYDSYLITPSEGVEQTQTSEKDSLRKSGTFSIKGGVIIAPNFDELSFGEKPINTDNLFEKVLVSMVDFLVPSVHAADLTASSIIPTVDFRDANPVGGGTSREVADMSSSEASISPCTTASTDILMRWRPVGNSTTGAVNICSRGTNADNSMVVDPAGDIFLAGSTVFIDRSANRLGIGTTTPPEDLSIVSSSPTISLNDTAGKVWEINSNNSSAVFDIANVTDGNQMFRIHSDAPDNTLVLDGPGVGIGTTTAGAKLDVRGDIHATFNGASAGGLQQLFRMSANNTTLASKSDVGFVMENAREGFSWAFRTEEGVEGFSASKQATGAREFTLSNTTGVASNVQLHLASGASNVAGQWLNASSRSYKKDIHDLSSEDAMQALRGLKSVTYQFKRDNSGEQRVGFIAEDVPELLATEDRKTVDPLQIIAVLTKAVQEQDRALTAKDKKITSMESKIDRLERIQKRLLKVEELLTHRLSGS